MSGSVSERVTGPRVRFYQVNAGKSGTSFGLKDEELGMSFRMWGRHVVQYLDIKNMAKVEKGDDALLTHTGC